MMRCKVYSSFGRKLTFCRELGKFVQRPSDDRLARKVNQSSPTSRSSPLALTLALTTLKTLALSTPRDVSRNSYFSRRPAFVERAEEIVPAVGEPWASRLRSAFEASAAEGLLLLATDALTLPCRLR